MTSSRLPSTVSQGASRTRDDGNALVEFVLVSILVIALAMGVIQLAVALHVRNMMVSAASEGAHLAATNDRGPDDGAQRTTELLDSALGDYPANVAAVSGEIAGAPAVTVTVSAPVPLFGLWGAGTMTVSARAFEEADRG